MAAYLPVDKIIEGLLEMPPFIKVNGDYERAKDMLMTTKEMHLDEWYDWWAEWFSTGDNDYATWDGFRGMLVRVAEMAGVALYVVNEDEEVVYVTFDMTRWIEKSTVYTRAKVALLDLYRYCNECTVIKTLDGTHDQSATRVEMSVRERDGDVSMDLTMLICTDDKDDTDIVILFDGGR